MKDFKYIKICDEDVLNLKNTINRLMGINRLMDTLTPNYEALEIFTIQNIIKQYEDVKQKEN
jgi:hypothetical protein